MGKLYEEELKFVGKKFVVKDEQKIKGCKMKRGDILEVVDYGSGAVSHYVEFLNTRLPTYKFKAGTWVFKNIIDYKEEA